MDLAPQIVLSAPYVNPSLVDFPLGSYTWTLVSHLSPDNQNSLVEIFIGTKICWVGLIVNQQLILKSVCSIECWVYSFFAKGRVWSKNQNGAFFNKYKYFFICFVLVCCKKMALMAKLLWVERNLTVFVLSAMRISGSGCVPGQQWNSSNEYTHSAVGSIVQPNGNCLTSRNCLTDWVVWKCALSSFISKFLGMNTFILFNCLYLCS